MTAVRRRRHSNAMEPPTSRRHSTFHVSSDELEPIVRPKSTPADERPRPTQRRRLDDDKDDDPPVEAYNEDDTSPSSDGSSFQQQPLPTSKQSTVISSSRLTRPLPGAKARKMTSNPLPQLSNPSLLPVQAHVARTGPASSQRRLYVVLEQACLESYRVSTGGRGGKSRGEGESFRYKY